MKVLRVPVESLAEGQLLLDAEASNYVLRVHRAGPNQALLLFDPAKAVEADAIVLGQRGKIAVCQVTGVRATQALPRFPLVLLQSFAKGDKVDRVIKDATALGVTAVVVVTTERSVVHVRDDDMATRRERWQRIVVDAARQCGRGDIPRLIGPSSLETLLSTTVELPSERLVLAPDGEGSLGNWMKSTPPCPLALFIGPEGGLDANELGLLREVGFRSVRFGDFILRTETAATAVLGAVVNWQQQ